MNRPVPNYFESSYFIHQRYADTSLTIFQQLEKKRQDEKRQRKQKGFSPEPSHVGFGHYGNPGAIAVKDSVAKVTHQSTIQSAVCVIT
ncbi:hypothetical protein ACJMK2_039684 [Sinanodonta woodiana]|uniref:Uncharacterized protein n=1 Tax=Sinanodonta woodiana TaxID=1069815 RepID=A0ABD3WCS4_SINWO